jgi:hypothetical protein
MKECPANFTILVQIPPWLTGSDTFKLSHPAPAPHVSYFCCSQRFALANVARAVHEIP